jgi:hypothetical protein
MAWLTGVGEDTCSASPAASQVSQGPTPLRNTCSYLMLTNVVLSPWGMKVHSIVVAVSYPVQSTTNRSFGTTSLTTTGTEKLYISHSQLTSAPGSSLPLLFVN